MSDDKIGAVASITSGTLYEAKYFGKEFIFLGNPYINLDCSKECAFSSKTTLSIYNVKSGILGIDFSDIVDVKINVKSIILPHRSNEIRTAFGDYWGQTELDLSIIINEVYARTYKENLNNKITKLNIISILLYLI